ncbi:MAG: GGDEF domain-containing protein, partial [Eubacteriales bacterium]
YVFQDLGGGKAVVTKHLDKLDWYLVVQSDSSSARSQVINMLLLNVVMCAAVLVIMILAMHIIANRTRALQQASFTDQSTRLLNRRAFEEEKARLAMSPLRNDFAYITADVNGLKAVNDNLGHAAGDELIQGAADCLRACFGKHGNIYRIGGDEFAAMLYLSQKQLKDAMKALDAATADWAGRLVKGLSISCGYATAREFPSENITELSRISDERMYAAKDAYYRETGEQRRR